MPGSMVFNGQVSTNAGPQTFQPTPVTLATPIGAVIVQAMASGDNTILIPTGTSYICVTPPTSNTVVIRLVSNAGTILHKTNPFAISQDPANNSTSFVINAASAITALFTIQFF